MTKTILLAEDTADDALLIKSAFQQAGFDLLFMHVWDGEQALFYLEGSGPYGDRLRFPIPDLLLLDLKMPRLDGFEVLDWIRKNPDWRALPVIVLTDSYFGADIQRAYALGANSFLTKPDEYQELLAAASHIGNYWLRRNVLPDLGPFIPAPAELPAAAAAPPAILDTRTPTLPGTLRSEQTAQDPEPPPSQDSP